MHRIIKKNNRKWVTGGVVSKILDNGFRVRTGLSEADYPRRCVRPSFNLFEFLEADQETDFGEEQRVIAQLEGRFEHQAPNVTGVTV